MYHINDNLECSLSVVSILDLIKISHDPFLFKHICRFFLGFRPNIQYVEFNKVTCSVEYYMTARKKMIILQHVFTIL